MDPLGEIKTIYFKATPETIQRDLARAVERRRPDRIWPQPKMPRPHRPWFAAATRPRSS